MTTSDDWTPAIGLRRVLVTVIWRSLICLPVWGGLVWFATPGLNYVPMHLAWFALLGLLLSVPGVAVGYALARGLTDRAGFVSPVITVIAAGFAWAVVYGGVEISNQFRPLYDWRSGFVAIAAGVFATLWIVKAKLIEE
jgi:hypothetical protein